MASHTATLASYARRGTPIPVDKDYLPVLEAVLLNLKKAESMLEMNDSPIQSGAPTPPATAVLQNNSLQIQSASTEKEDDSKLQNPQTSIPSPAEISAKEGLRKMNDRVSALIMKRKEELENGIQDSPTRRQLTLVKSINDQFNFITKISEDLLKVISKWI
jgi:hypothetical protein